MMRVYRNNSTDAAYNISLEERIFENFKGDDELFMLWRNDKAVIVGGSQIIANEVNLDFAKEHNIHIVRRKTGGGAVYHDLGNVNYTYIGKKAAQFGDFLTFAQPVIGYLHSRGIDALHIGKNDICVNLGQETRKISGGAQRIRGQYILHHGTLMFDVDMSLLENVLTPDPAKLTGKGISSVRSRVCNISSLLPAPAEKLSREALRDGFWEDICAYFGAADGIEDYLKPLRGCV